jgi:UDP-4-amino-4,6-dideoxy-N-acetyl-beta-L-altrosamine N-acetyltransferase|tara:strand:- start:200 stop:796 length:597 start_codon:yes stop_codon:yes gene_type:complete
MHKIYLKNILEVDEKKKKLILSIRNSTFVNSQMYTDHQITSEEHFNWLKNLHTKKEQCVFAVINKDLVVGIVSLNNIQFKKKKTAWAFYLNEKNIYGLGPTLEYNFINYIINNNFEELNCEVLETNSKVISLHKKFLFEESKENTKFITKDRKKINVVFLSLRASKWKEKNFLIKNRYARLIDKFDIIIDSLDEKYKS